MNELLLVVDMQNGFVYSRTEHILGNVLQLIQKFKDEQKLVVFTRFINKPNSGYVKWIHWSRFMQQPETDLIAPLSPYANTVIEKYGYTAFVPEFQKILSEKKVERVYICGIATDGCVLKTSVDCFENSIEPIVVQDACASHAGPEIHTSGLLLISRFIGKDQVLSTQDVLSR